MLLTLAIQINKVFLLHIDLHGTWWFGIICRNSKMLLLLGTSRNISIVGVHLCVQLLKGHLVFGKRNGGFFVSFQDVILKFKKEWYWLQWVNFIRISNSIDDDFAEIIGQTHVGNTEAETDTNEMEAPDIYS